MYIKHTKGEGVFLKRMKAYNGGGVQKLPNLSKPTF